MPQKYTPEEIGRRIHELGREEEWFHCIDLGNGILTKPDPIPHMQNLWNHIACNLPPDLSGMTVLDIGCNAGFFSVAAKRLGADHVVGVDMSPGFLKQARFVSDVLDLDLEFHRMSVYELSKLDKKFDVVFCLGLIYHVADPVKAAESIMGVTKRLAVVESALMGAGCPERPLWELVFPGYASDASQEGERHYNWWFPNMAGMVKLFQGIGFKDVQVMHEENDRGGIVCRM
jgi:tRNA (mo5U34)-methyltransferase